MGGIQIMKYKINWWRTAFLSLIGYIGAVSIIGFIIKHKTSLHDNVVANTSCVSEGEIIIRYDTTLDSAQRVMAAIHESVHVVQAMVLHCDKMNQLNRTAFGQLKIEAPAYCVQGLNEKNAVDVLMQYALIKTIPRYMVESYYSKICKR
jgi:hypothetical protein